MNRINFDNEKEWEFLVNVKWPHEGFAVGFDYFPIDKTSEFKSFFLYCGFITFIFNWN